MLVPGRLAIVMGVHVDEARRHDFPRSIERFVGRVSGKRADGFDNTVFDADILVLGRGARPVIDLAISCLLYTSPSPRDATLSRMPSSA